MNTTRHLTWFALVALIAGCGGGDTSKSDGSADGDVTDCAGAADGTSCGAGQVCIAEACVASECGDGVTDAASGEECDDGNGSDGDGCNTDCKYSCHADEDCSDAEPCNGEEICSPELHRCQDGAVPDCDDADDCTTDSCVAGAGCENAFIDGDLDGYSPNDCNPEGDYAGKGGDCNDDPTMMGGAQSPGLGENCGNGIDDNCNGLVDNADPTVGSVCYRDLDDDGYPDESTTQPGCACPAGWMAPRADDKWDCKDNDEDVHEGQTAYFTTPHCANGTKATWQNIGSYPFIFYTWVCNDSSSASFDYNCDGVSTQQFTKVNTTTCGQTVLYPGGPTFCSGSGWTGSTVPACGMAASFRSCSFIACNNVDTNTQGCR